MVPLGIPCNSEVEKKKATKLQLVIWARLNWNQWADKILAYRKLKIILVRREDG